MKVFTACFVLFDPAVTVVWKVSALTCLFLSQVHNLSPIAFFPLLFWDHGPFDKKKIKEIGSGFAFMSKWGQSRCQLRPLHFSAVPYQRPQCFLRMWRSLRPRLDFQGLTKLLVLTISRPFFQSSWPATTYSDPTVEKGKKSCNVFQICWECHYSTVKKKEKKKWLWKCTSYSYNKLNTVLPWLA